MFVLAEAAKEKRDEGGTSVEVLFHLVFSYLIFSISRASGYGEEVFQNFMSLWGHDGFGMELETIDGVVPVFYGHDFSVFCGGCNL